jgi:hypothetical protein
MEETMQKTIKFKLLAEKKHSVRYQEEGDEKVIGSIYLSKSVLEKPWPEEVTVTLEW